MLRGASTLSIVPRRDKLVMLRNAFYRYDSMNLYMGKKLIHACTAIIKLANTSYIGNKKCLSGRGGGGGGDITGV